MEVRILRTGVHGLRFRFAVLALAAAACLAAAAGAAASPYVQAHRGGSLTTVGGEQKPLYPESSMPAYRAAAKRGFVLELDVKLTADNRPVVIHDATLDRTTDCGGEVAALTLAQLREGCEIDLLGTEGNEKRLGKKDDRRAKIPTLRQVLVLARERGVDVNVEIKNLPTDPDFDPGPGYAQSVAAEVKASAIPPSRVIFQSFFPSNLDVIENDPYFERSETSFLTLGAIEAAGPTVADGAGYDWVSPQWPVSDGYVERAHALGLRIVPYTIDTPAQVRAATEAGVDALITDDPRMARRAVRSAAPPRPRIPKPPDRRSCGRAAAGDRVTPIESFHPDDSGPRVFALQFKQELDNVATYGSFRTKIECMIREYVVPRMAGDRPNVVALTEDVGLMTLATGSRGRATREAIGSKGPIPGCANQPSPCGVVATLTSIEAAYGPQLAAYEARFGALPGLGQSFVAGTDTFARGWMQTFSDMARRYGVYILGSNNQPEFRESVDPSEIAAFADPDVPHPRSAFVATSPDVYNEVFMWGPEDVTREGPAPLRNVVTSNQKVPLTEIENALQVTPGPSSGPDAIENLRPYKLPGSKAKISFATSLPAFVYDGGPVSPYGEAPPEDVDPCSDTASYYMYCMEKLGANVVMQDEANPGRWATPEGGEWQPLEWMSSTWRSSADPTVSFDYNVTPFMVGNLADLPFDGQSAITQRGLRGSPTQRPSERRCNYVGDARLMPGAPENDPSAYEVYAGPKSEFLGLAPWVSGSNSREKLRRAGAGLDRASGSRIENDYIETAVIADLPFPPDRSRPSCNGGSVTVAGRCANLRVGSDEGEKFTASGAGDRMRGMAGNDQMRSLGGADCLLGEGGDDALFPGDGADRVDGGRGDDRIRALHGGTDRISCGAGEDDVYMDRTDRATRSCETVRFKQGQFKRPAA